MKVVTKQFLYWTPRVLTLLFAAFITLFAFDVFSESNGFWETALGLCIHLIPTAFIIAVLALSWKREWIGGIIFILLAIIYVPVAVSRLRAWLSASLVIAGPMLLIGVLFIVNWLHRSQIRGSSESQQEKQ